jgi:hypothetical protein
MQDLVDLHEYGQEHRRELDHDCQPATGTPRLPSLASLHLARPSLAAGLAGHPASFLWDRGSVHSSGTDSGAPPERSQPRQTISGLGQECQTRRERSKAAKRQADILTCPEPQPVLRPVSRAAGRPPVLVSDSGVSDRPATLADDVLPGGAKGTRTPDPLLAKTVGLAVWRVRERP